MLIEKNGVVHQIALNASEAQKTNNRTELTAAIEAIKVLPESSKVEVFTDSQYLQKGFSEWMPSWKKSLDTQKSLFVIKVGGMRKIDRLVPITVCSTNIRFVTCHCVNYNDLWRDARL